MKARKIYQYDLNGELLKIWNSSIEICGVNNYNRGNITSCCLGKSSKAYGFLWLYEEQLHELENRLIIANKTRSDISKETWDNKKECINEKRRSNSLIKFGVSHHMKLDSYKKTGDSNIAKNEDTKDKIRQTERKSKFDNLLKRFTELEFIKFIESDVIEFKSLLCNHTFQINRQLLIVRKNHGHTICTQCNPIGINHTSEAQNEVSNFIKEMDIEILENAKGILDGRLELDIYIPNFSFAIEFNGLRYHNSLYKSSNYHLKKTEMCDKLGIRLFHIFEDEWEFKKDIIKSMIKNFLNKSDKIYARNCEILELTHLQQSAFYDNNHLQGSVPCEFSYGLFYKNELVAAMSFSKPRAALSKIPCKESFELLRFCNKKGLSIVGGASKILKHFIKNHKCENILSYANRRWSNGNLYESLGFIKNGVSQPNYWYIKDNLRINRFLFRKSKLISKGYDPNKSELEITEELGIPRIYDCGNFRYLYKIIE